MIHKIDLYQGSLLVFLIIFHFLLISEPAAELQTKPDEEENLEEWLEDILDD